MSGWSMVWFAPVWRSSGGRSAVSRIMGTPPVAASTTGGRPLATAVPEVVIQAAGRPVARAWPRAAKAVPRSSKWTSFLALLFPASAATRGVEREPGATQKEPTPQRTSSSTIRRAQRRLACALARGVSLFKPEHSGEVADLLLYLGPLLVGHGAGDDPGPREQRDLPPPYEPRADADGELGCVGPDPTYRTCVPAPVERLYRPDLPERLPPRVPADGGRRVQRIGERGVSYALAERRADPRAQVPSARELHLRDAALDLDLLAQRPERLLYHDPDVGVLGEVLLAVQQVVAQAVVVRRGRAAGPGPGHGLGLDDPPLAAEQPLGRGPQESHPALGLDVE